MSKEKSLHKYLPEIKINLSIVSFITIMERERYRGLVALKDLVKTNNLYVVFFAATSPGSTSTYFCTQAYSYTLKKETTSPSEALPTRVHYVTSQ
jgi:hypothetical protein